METQDEQIQQAARELIARHGSNAVAFASDRVDSVARLGSRPDLDLAYRVLSAVERLVAELAAICLETDPRVQSVEVTVEKPGALRFARSVGITIHRSRV